MIICLKLRSPKAKTKIKKILHPNHFLLNLNIVFIRQFLDPRSSKSKQKTKMVLKLELLFHI